MADADAPPPPIRRSRRLWWIGSAAATVVALVVTAVAVWPSHPARSARATAASGPPPAADPALLPRPSASAPESDWQDWVGQEATAALRRQQTALLAGDFTAYQADALPAASAQLGRWFRSLRALRVTEFDQHLDGSPHQPSKPGGDWRAVTVAEHCFVDTDCPVDVAVFDTMWRVTPAGLRLTGFRVHGDEPCVKCPDGTELVTRPWETTELTAVAGPRTLVAVPLAYRSRLADISRRAEAAATVADRYTIGDGRVDRYRVFVADPESWKSWFYGSPGRWAAGSAVPTGKTRIDTEVLAGQLTPGYADQLLRRMLAQVSTLRSNVYYGDDDVWWLSEGIADMAGNEGDALGPARELLAVHRFTDSHRLTTVVLPPPASTASAADVTARYAVGYFAVKYLMQKYGRAAALAFFQQAVQDGVGLDTASRSALHKPWSQVDRECVAAVRRI